MATFKWQDREVEVVEDWRVGEQVEAENALGVDLEKVSSGGRMAFVLFVSIRRTDKQIPAHVLADQVMGMQVTEIVGDTEEEGDARPPAEDAASEPESKSASEGRPTTGSQPTVTTSR